MFLRRLLNTALVNASVFTIVMTPVSQGLAAEKQTNEINRQKVQQALLTMGLNKSMTYGEFWEKNKQTYPERLQKVLGPYFTKFSKEVMPQFEVEEAKGSNGQPVPVLRITQKGQLHNIQLIGDVDNFAKFNNTMLSATDLINFDDAFYRLSAADIKLRRQLVADANPPVTPKTGYPEISLATWKTMSQAQRASYVLNLRDLWMDAKNVLAEESKLKPKSKAKSKKYSILEWLLDEKAYAQNAFDGEVTQEALPPAPKPNFKPPVNPYSKKVTGPSAAEDESSKPSAKTAAALEGTTCIVAGYVSRYVKGKCSIDDVIDRHNSNESYIKKTNDICASSGKYACNPLIYGTPGGSPICLSKADPTFQIATHWSENQSTCDKQARLTNTKIEAQGNNKDTAFYVDLASKSQTAAFEDQKKSNFERSKNFIDGLLLAKGKNKLGKEPLSAEDFELIKTIRDNFNEDIQKARESCTGNLSYKGHEKNFYGACEQLHKRFLFVAEVLSDSPGCKDGSKMNPNTLQCICDDNKEVIPGNTCPKDPKPPVVTPGDGNTETPCDLTCPSGTVCKFVPQSNGKEVKECVGTPKETVPVEKAKKKGKFGQFMLKALPWIAGAGVLVGMYFLWKPHFPKLKAAGDTCANGTTTCASSCTSPLSYINGSCQCASCAPGQTIIDASACLCGTAGTGNTICGDGVTVVTDPNDCPKTIVCSDGSIVSSQINCPDTTPIQKTNSQKVNTTK